MQRDIVVKGRGLGGSADLTLLAPIKPGFVESLESVTYKSRIKRVLETLHGARTTAHEYATARLLSDSVERVGAIHSVRVAVLEPEDKVLLAVTFEGSWESYIRVLWDKVGTLLDLIFCGTVDYVTAYDHTFEEWLVWARRVQVETGFFYGPPDSTARDVLYQRRVERMRVRGVGDEPSEMRAVLPSAEEIVQRVVHPLKLLKPDDPQVIQPHDYLRMGRERMRNGMQGLAGLYRLTDLHRPGTADGEVLRRAAIDLLQEFVQLWGSGHLRDEIAEARAGRFPRQLSWIFPDGEPKPNERERPPAPETMGDKVPDAILADIQGGIVRAYHKLTHGAILMLAFRSAAAARDLLSWLSGRITNGTEQRDSSPVKPFFNIAFTVVGLRALGMDEDTLELFPEEYRQGMAARAGLIGDVRNNHPRRWRLPRRMASLDPPPAAGNPDAGHQSIEIDTIHAVVQLSCEAAGVPAGTDLTDRRHPLRDAAALLLRENPKVELLAGQALVRRYRAGSSGLVQEHFGYVDGIGQPDVEAGTPPNVANRVHLGEVVCGHANAADFEPNPTDPSLPDSVKGRLRWLGNGSFLIVRKYRQFAHRLERAVEVAAQDIVSAFPNEQLDLEACKEVVYAKLMGRTRQGVPLVRRTVTNNFDYAGDEGGEKCPLHAHIRLANPRADSSTAARLPRIMRRGMSYGPEHVPGTDDDGQERGVLFMAYNADIGEQYEVVQKWLTGGNSTGSSSGQSCPMVGVPENGFPRHFRFEYNGKVFHVVLENGTPLFEEPEVVTRLEWGMYLFAPSLGALQRLQQLAAAAAAAAPAAAAPWKTSRGEELIKAIEKVRAEQGVDAAASAWKTVIEDPESIERMDSAAVWAAIRDKHGGALQTNTPYGTVVASRELLAEVLLDPDQRYSICGQFKRMQDTIGEIFLGRDAGRQYDDEAIPINRAAGELTDTVAKQEKVFEIAFECAKKKIDAIIDEAKRQSAKVCDARFEVGFEAREVVDEVLADLCDAWFGLRGSPHFQRGSSDLAWQNTRPPLYPGHFTALSRYMFQPNPGALPKELAELYGKALRTAMNRFVAEHRNNGTTPRQPDGNDAPIACAVFNHPLYRNDEDWVARTMTGVMMGFIAPIIGAVLNVLREWQREGRFGALRAELAGRTGRAVAHDLLKDSMAAAARMRPMPQIVWRTAVKPHRLGAGANGIDIAKDEKIVLGLVSGTQQSLQDGKDDGRLMFGGKREAAPHPTHACPGYHAAIEAMVGTLTAFLSCGEKMRQGVAPLTFVAEGSVQLPPRCSASPDVESPIPNAGAVPARVLVDIRLSGGLLKPLPPTPQSNGLVLAVGDSWLDNPYTVLPFFGKDLRDYLEKFGYLIPKDCCHYEKFGEARILAEDLAKPLLKSKIRKFIVTQIQNLDDGVIPRAVLLSAGGNDSTGTIFLAMLDHNDHNSNTLAINAQALRRHIEQNLKPKYETILDGIRAALDAQKVDIPIIVQGYDHPLLPNEAWGKAEWFRDQFVTKGYDFVNDHQEEVDALAEVIDKFNGMLATSAQQRPYVRYVNLRGTIKEYWSDPIAAWRDDLHPENDPFFVMATKIDAIIKAPYP